MRPWIARLTPTAIMALLLAASVVAARPANAGTSIRAREVVGDLNQPVAFTFGPGRKIWYVEKTSGEIRVHDLDTDADRRFVRVSGVSGLGERGMLGIALHPDFPRRRFVYVYVTRRSEGVLRNQIVRYRDDHGRGTGRRVLLSTVASAGGSHNGGRILFGPDGMLYVVVGDATESSNAQDLSHENRGKILRITPNGGGRADNPFNSRVWAFGIRNSFGLAFDPQTDSLWETENGPECNDEVNLILAGANYGWGPNETCSGSSPQNTNQDGTNPVLPELFYGNTVGITGIAFCGSCGLGHRSEGAAFAGAVNNGNVTRIRFNDRRTAISGHAVVYQHRGGTLSFEVGPSGAIYFSDFDGINKLVRR